MGSCLTHMEERKERIEPDQTREKWLLVFILVCDSPSVIKPSPITIRMIDKINTDVAYG